ncbi:MAG: DUF4347 domain-containing protein [Chromatiaceae bacterium]|nr:DUF4347 domain-containing protein [Chromatiaceae bacterium]
MSTEKKLKRAHERMQMELMEPRMLLSADLLALAGLPGVDHHDDDAPWDSLLSDPSDLPGESSGNNGQLPSPLELSSFSGADAGAASSDQQSDSLLALLSDGDRTESAGQLLFVDTRVPDYADLIDQIRQAHPGDELQIHLIDAGEDGVNQITDVLANYSGIDAVHIISHGNSDGLQLGSTWLSSNNLNAFAGQLGSWSGSLTQDADLLLYGCDLAATAEGKGLADAIATLTGADVAASTDLTGQAGLGGDWELEYQTGFVESAAFGAAPLQQWNGLLAVINVTTFNDLSDGGDTSSVANLIATPGSDGISLREAIIAANGDSSVDDQIVLSAGTYTLALAGTAENSGFTGDLDILDNLTITGAGANVTIIDGGDIDRVFEVSNSSAATISGLTIRDGNAGSKDGGGIQVGAGASLSLTDVRVTSNYAQKGGGIWSGGVLTMDRVTVDQNLSFSHAAGVLVKDSGSATLSNTTLSQNLAGGKGGGLYVEGTALLTNTTVAYNTDLNSSGGDGIHNQSGSVQLKNTLLHNPAGINYAGSGSITSLGYNIDSDGTAGISNSGDQSGTLAARLDVKIDSLQFNGGTTPTHALLAGSPAIDAGSNAGVPVLDQRGYARPADGDGDLTATTDIGAYEYDAAAPDSDGDGIWDIYEDANSDSDFDPATNPGPDTDGDSTPNYLDSDDDGDGILTSAENADPNSDGNPRDALDSDHDGQPDWLDPALTTATDGIVDSTHKLSSTTSAALAAAIDNRDRFGSGVASIGDLDGDGVVDVAVGARNDDDGVDDTGAVYILFMNADGTIKATQKISDSSGGLTASLDNGDNFGRSVAGIGDINGDGIGDIAVGADYDDDGGSDRGAVYILMLNSDGTVKAEQKISSTAGGLTGGLANNDRFGRAVAGIGDLDGDGIDDIAVGAEKDDDGGTNRGAVYVLMLNADGTVKAQQKISDNAGGLAAALDDGDAFGVSVAGLGDLNGDGTNDIAVGTLYDDDGGSDRGAVYILFMNADGTVNAEQKISSLSGGLPAVLANGDSFGASVAAIGDANGDGTPDLLVGADADDDGGSDRGAVYLLFMNADGTVNSQQKISSTTGGLSVALDDDGWFGVSAASLGDLNGDGILDLLVGADKNNDGGNNRGAVYVLNLQAASSNSAPVLATAPAPSLTAIDEDDTTPAGDSVAAIVVDGSISDTDGAVESIAITAVDNSNGTWQYSTDNGSSWSNVDDGSLAANHALLLDGTLAGASTQKLRFVPAADYNGSASFTFRAWDQSSGSAGSYADTGSNGGTSAFSSATDSATITVNPVNDAPTLSGGPYDLGSTIAFNTSSGVQVAAILAGVTSGDNDGDTLGIAVTALSGNNLWKYSADSSDGVDGNWQDVGAVASNNALLLDQNSWLRYVPDGSNAETPAVTFHAWDRSSGSASTGTQSYADSGSGSAFSSGSAQAQLTVTPSNNPPTGGVTIDNNAPTQGQTLTAANTLADADGITPPIGYQWLRDGAPIAGATSGSYTTVQADVNKVISVTASYTDGLGNEESSTSAGTAAVLNADDAGVVTIDDTTPAQGQTLTASVSDLDGISDGIGYQWFRDGNPIAGATSISYTTLQADVGKAISVAASYTDDFGGVEAPLSADTVNVANVNDAGSISIDDTTPTQGQTLTASINDADGAGGPTSYQWYADGIAISGATNSSYTLVQDDVTKVISVAASYTDDLGSTETPLSEETSAVANVNDAGTVSINNTTPAQGQTLTASVSDSDGASGTISYQWYRDSSPISGATSGSYTTTQADVGKAVSVAASYTDDLTTVENPVSAATAPVTEVNDAPTFSQFYDALGITDEDTEVEITLATLLAVGDEADVDIGGSIDGFLVTSVASGTLKIGADAGSATAWAATTNDIVDSTNKAYWTPAGNAHGILNAFVAAAVDDAGAASSGSATGQVIVSAVNDAPTGLPTIGGAATEHVTLNVDTSGIGDADGLGSFSYQWLRDGAVVSGATGISYALDDIDVGSRMSVKISYVDDDDTSETLTSAQTAVVAAVNDAPTVLRNQLTLTQGESVILSSAMLAATDVDDDDNSLLFTLTSVNGGRFELISNPGVAIASFTQAQVSAGQVRFVDDGDNIAPSFTLQVSDSQVSVSSDASIGFAPNPKPTTLTIADNIALPATISKEDPAVNVVKADPEITDQVDDTEEETATEAEEEATAGEEAFAESAADDDRDTAAGAIENPVNQKGSTAESGSGLHSIFNHNALRNPFVNLLLGAVAAPDLPAVPKLLTSEIHTVLTASGFLKDLDRIRGTTNEASNIEQQRVASTIAVSTGLSVGYVAWLIRSGVLLSTALSSLPAWHFVDPLPVLGTIAANQSQGRGRDDEEDSVESMFKDQATPADNMESGKETQINTSRNNSDPSEHSQLQR